MTDAIEAGARAIALADLDEETKAVIDVNKHMVFVRAHYEELAKACIEAAIASGALVPASEGPISEEISTLAHRFWSIHPSEIAAKNLTREDFYALEMTKLVQKATMSAVAEMRERCIRAQVELRGIGSRSRFGPPCSTPPAENGGWK